MHSLSFINKPVGDNETEKQMIDLITTHEMNLGSGYTRTFYEIFMVYQIINFSEYGKRPFIESTNY